MAITRAHELLLGVLSQEYERQSGSSLTARADAVLGLVKFAQTAGEAEFFKGFAEGLQRAAERRPDRLDTRIAA